MDFALAAVFSAEQKKRYVFELRSKEEIFYMAAETSSEMEQWKEMIDMVIQGPLHDN